MAKPWDESMKTLVRANPQAMTRWLIANATFLRELHEELKGENQEVDSLLEVAVNGKKMLLHIEFQTYYDKTMAERLLQYNVVARSKYQLPVLSFVLYLLSDGVVASSPLRWTVPTGLEVLQFHFHSIELAKLSPEDIRSTGEINLLPLIPLTKGGATPESVSRMLHELDTPEYKDLALVGFKLASLVFKRKSQDNLTWLIRSFKEMHDILHDTPIYQLILEEGREKGLQEGLKEGLKEGHLKGLKEGRGKGLKAGRGKGLKEGLAKAREEECLNLRLIIVNIVQARFPDLVETVKIQVAPLEDIAVLRQLVIQLGTAEGRESIQQCFTTDHPTAH